MNLDHLHYIHCPTCNAPVVSERKERQHYNGHWNETQEFTCGMSLKWSPNFMDIDIRSCRPCPNTAEEVAKKDKRKIALKKVIDYIQKLDIDKEYKIHLLNEVKSGTRYL